MWLHVDAAYAGSAFVCPEFRKWMKVTLFLHLIIRAGINTPDLDRIETIISKILIWLIILLILILISMLVKIILMIMIMIMTMIMIILIIMIMIMTDVAGN